MLDKLGFEYISYAHLYSFSHAYPNHLAQYIKEVNPKYVVGVHSAKPENINPVNSIQLFPIENKAYEFIDAKLNI